MADATKLNQAARMISFSVVSDGSLNSLDIPRIVEQYKPILLGSGFEFEQPDFDRLIKLLETQHVTTMGGGISLVDNDVPHNEEWFLNREIARQYWEDYEAHLVSKGWPMRVVSSMAVVTDKILRFLKDPIDEGEWERRGLVIGHVQSGKTANYIGLIAKAADAGYKFIIVIAGIHNNLRTQTQERIDEGFIGRDSKTKRPIGVSLLRPNRAMPVTVTTTESDFNKSVARSFGMELKSLNNTFILVIKKNASTLSSLYNWLKELNTRQGLEKISDIPMLLIDDEADNASINTNKPDLDPTRINKEIRLILNLFRKRCYVGYTATPFANIFIDPNSKDDMLGNDLFPEHFIYSLDAPSNYFGSGKIFLNESGDNVFVKHIDDAEASIPLTHKKDFSITELPLSLKEAMRLFILSRAIRNIRGQATTYCSMLINISRFVDIQKDIEYLVREYLDQLTKAVRYNYRLAFEEANRDKFISSLHDDFSKEYAASGTSWTAILGELNNAASSVKLFVVNSKSEEVLDYKSYSKDGNALTAIVIGGLSLSRGLTIEGLTISYIYRNSIMYDTLMQMGRWFGYRDNYEDLCRIYMSNASEGWYSYIAGDD